MNTSLAPLLNCHQAAHLLGVSVKTIRHWAQTGKIKAKKLGTRGDWRFTREDLMLIVQERGIAGVSSNTPGDTNERQHYIDELRESEQRFRNLADTAPMYIAMADEKGQAVYFNKPWLKFTGKKLKEMLGLGWLSTLHPDDAPKFEKDFKRAFKKQIPINEQYRFKNADGQFCWMLAVGAPRFTPEGRFIGYYGTYSDIHAIKEAQIAMQESQERYRTLLNSVDEGFCIIEMIFNQRGKPVDYLFLEVNGVFEKQTGLKNAVGKSMKDLVPDQDEHWFEIYGHVAVTGQPVRFENHSKAMNRWFNVFATRVGGPESHKVALLFSDISQRKLAEETIKDSEARFRIMADAAPNLVWMLSPEGSMTYMNEKGLKLLGVSLAKIIEDSWMPYVHPEDINEAATRLKTAIKKRRTYRFEHRIKHHDGVYRWVLSSADPSFLPDGQLYAYIGSSIDITEEKRAQEEMREFIKVTEQRNALIKINKTKDEFIGMASHQLRTPATAVKQYLGILLNEYAGPIPPQQKDMIQIAYDSNERELNIINDLLKTAQIDSGEYQLSRKKHDLIGLVNECINELRSTFEIRNQTVTFKSPEGPLKMLVDDIEIRLIFINLLENASKYSHRGTNISVTIKEKDNYAHVSITDKGVGINKEDQKRIFDKFTRVNNELSDTIAGNGLGLYWVQQIVSMHRGSIILNSTPGRGSTFTVLLPI